MTFSEVREYQYGDEIRAIDWNVTARQSKPHIKIFEEERELTVMLLVDVSGSRNFGTLTQSKKDMMAEVAATLSFSTIENNDKVGVILFSDKIEMFIPPKKGRSHLLHIIREMLELQPASDGTDIGEALRFLTNAIKKKCTAFLLSDMIDPDASGNPRYEDALKVAVNRHDLSVIKVHDPRERNIPAVGLVHVKDSETGEGAWINTDSRKVRESYAQWFSLMNERQTAIFNKYQVDNVDIPTDSDYVKGLMALFNRR